MITAWTKNLKTEDQVKEFHKQFRNSSDVLTRLQEIIKEDLTNMDKSDTDFDVPNWEFKQANTIGQRSYASKILKLINLDQGIKTNDR